MGTQGAGVGFEGSHSRGEHGNRQEGREKARARKAQLLLQLTCFCFSFFSGGGSRTPFTFSAQFSVWVAESESERLIVGRLLSAVEGGVLDLLRHGLEVRDSSGVCVWVGLGCRRRRWRRRWIWKQENAA